MTRFCEQRRETLGMRRSHGYGTQGTKGATKVGDATPLMAIMNVSCPPNVFCRK